MNESQEHGPRGDGGRDEPAAAGHEQEHDDGHAAPQDPRGDGGRDEPATAERGQEHDDGHAARGQGRWPRPGVAEQLLNGEDVTDADPRSAEMAGLLAAARVLPPGRPQDEAAALEAFRRAAAVPAPAVRGHRWRTRRGPRPVRLLIGGALAVSALGGVAIAAQDGGLTHPFHSSGGGTHSPSASAPAPSARGTGTAPGLPRTPGATPGHGTPPTLAGTVPPTSGPPADTGMQGLCEAYAKAKGEGKAPDKAIQARLAEAAGSAAGIDAYCAARTAAPSPGHGHGHVQKTPAPHTGPPSPVSTPPKAAAPGATRHR
jgi:hypothetical protein